MRFISIGKIDSNLISIIIGCIFCFLNRLLNQYNALLFENSILADVIVSVSYLFAIIPLIILKIRSKRKNKDDIEKANDNKIEYIFTDIKYQITKGKKRFILLSAIIFFVQSFLFVTTLKIKANAWILEILFTSIFYFFIFKKKLYKHHYLSIVLIIIIGLIIDLVLGNLQNNISNNILSLLIRFVREILNSLSDVIDKYIMEKKFGLIYEILFFVGLINTILLSTFAAIDYYYFDLEDLEKYYNNFNSIELLVIFGVMITQFGLYLTILLTNQNFTPCHIFIIFAFGQFAFYLDFSGISIIVIICLIFILFFALIFNEIIEINLWGLSENTRRNIGSRAETESEANILIKNGTLDLNSEKDENIIELKDYVAYY